MLHTNISTSDHINLSTISIGTGDAIVFVHEFAGDMYSWTPQIEYFSRSYRCIAFNARGYPPSDVPLTIDAYSQERARDDILNVLDGLGVQQVHLVGLSMGAFASLHFAFAYPKRIRSLTLAGCGYGAEPQLTQSFRNDALALASALELHGLEKLGPQYARGPARVQFERSNSLGFSKFEQNLINHSNLGMARTMVGVQANRPSLWNLVTQMQQLTTPVLIINGDEDQGCLIPGLFMKKHISACGLVTFPCAGHTINLEEPALFNQFLSDFLHRTEIGRWPVRDPRSISNRTLGEFRK